MSRTNIDTACEVLDSLSVLFRSLADISQADVDLMTAYSDRVDNLQMMAAGMAAVDFYGKIVDDRYFEAVCRKIDVVKNAALNYGRDCTLKDFGDELKMRSEFIKQNFENTAAKVDKAKKICFTIQEEIKKNRAAFKSGLQAAELAQKTPETYFDPGIMIEIELGLTERNSRIESLNTNLEKARFEYRSRVV